MPKNLVGAGISFDVMSSHATRLIAMLIGGAILTSDSTGDCMHCNSSRMRSLAFS